LRKKPATDHHHLYSRTVSDYARIISAMNTREIVYKYYESVNASDWDTWLTLFDANVVIDEQLAGHAEGASGLRGAIDGIKRGYATFQMHPLHIVIEGDQASVIWHCSAANASGIPIEAHGA